MNSTKTQLKKHLAKRFPYMSEDDLNQSVENLLAFAEVITNSGGTDVTESAVLTDSKTSSTIGGNQ